MGFDVAAARIAIDGKWWGVLVGTKLGTVLTVRCGLANRLSNIGRDRHGAVPTALDDSFLSPCRKSERHALFAFPLDVPARAVSTSTCVRYLSVLPYSPLLSVGAFFAHRAWAALRADSLRSSSVIVSSRALPPFLPREGSLAKVPKSAQPSAVVLCAATVR
jgi:hypothetical protein